MGLFSQRRTQIRGGILVALLVLLAILGGGFLALERHKQRMEREARAYANETIERLLFAHDPTYLSKNVSRAAEREFFPSRQDAFLAHLVAAGEPARPVTLEGEVKFESRFFHPSAEFRARLLFYRGPGVLGLNVSHPGDRWQIDFIGITWNLSGGR